MLRNSVKVERISARYGSKKGFFLTYYYRLICFLGVYNHYYKVDWKSVERIIFICKGNVCRSAYADVIAQSVNLNVASCGVHARMGARANERAIKAAMLRGVNLKEHRTTPLSNIEFKKTDLVIAMEPWQAEYVNKEHKGECNITLLGLWGDPRLPYIHDPYGLSAEYFDVCFSYIENALANINELIKNNQVH